MCDTGATFVAMAEVASRELRNNTADVLRRVQAGEEITITVRGKAVAEVVPVGTKRRHWVTRDELFRILDEIPYDPTLAEDIKWISGGTTDDLGPIV